MLTLAAQAGGSIFGRDAECSGPPHRGTVSKLDTNASIAREDVVRALDRIRDKVEEWGVVTISSPIAVLDSSAFYVPSNIVSPEQAYEEARVGVQAAASQATERGISNQFGGVATPFTIPVPQVSSANGGTATQTTTVTTPPPRELRDANGNPISSLNSEAIVLPPKATAGDFAPITAPFALDSKMPSPTKSVAQALREAQDNTMRQKIYTAMSSPQQIDGFNHVVFAIVQVSCNPGWRTQEHYIADCSASLEYYDLCKKEHLSRSERRAPTVFAVLPLIDAQTVEMANSQREVTQLAAQLAASMPGKGVDFKAKDLFEFVKRYSRDLRSRTPIPVVNSYSSGGTFGFRFSPSFQAMKDPAQKKTRAANLLLPTSFPALITVVIKDADFRYVKDQRFEQPAVLTHTSTRWYLKDRPPLWQFPKRLVTPMRRDTAAMEINAAQDVGVVYTAKRQFESYSGGSARDGKFNPMYEEMRREIIALEEKGIGRDWPLLLPSLELIRSLPAVEAHQRKVNQELREAEDAARLNRENRAIELKKAGLPIPLFRSSQIAPPPASESGAATSAAPRSVTQTSLFPTGTTAANLLDEPLLDEAALSRIAPPMTPASQRR